MGFSQFSVKRATGTHSPTRSSSGGNIRGATRCAPRPLGQGRLAQHGRLQLPACFAGLLPLGALIVDESLTRPPRLGRRRCRRERPDALACRQTPPHPRYGECAACLDSRPSSRPAPPPPAAPGARRAGFSHAPPPPPSSVRCRVSKLGSQSAPRPLRDLWRFAAVESFGDLLAILPWPASRESEQARGVGRPRARLGHLQPAGRTHASRSAACTHAERQFGAPAARESAAAGRSLSGGHRAVTARAAHAVRPRRTRELPGACDTAYTWRRLTQTTTLTRPPAATAATSRAEASRTSGAASTRRRSPRRRRSQRRRKRRGGAARRHASIPRRPPRLGAAAREEAAT